MNIPIGLIFIAFACALFVLGSWGRAHSDSLVVDAIQGEERDRRIAVLRRGAMTCQVVALVFLAFGFWVIAAG